MFGRSVLGCSANGTWGMIAGNWITVKVSVLKIYPFERETRKWSAWKELAGILQFGETVRRGSREKYVD